MPVSGRVVQLTSWSNRAEAGPPHLGSNFKVQVPASSWLGSNFGVLLSAVGGCWLAGSRKRTKQEPHGENSSGNVVCPSFSSYAAAKWCSPDTASQISGALPVTRKLQRTASPRFGRLATK